jgi:hypothetical protein
MINGVSVMNKKIIFLCFVFVIGIGYLIYSINASLSGQFPNLQSLKEYNFEELDMKFDAPDNLVLFDVTHSSYLHEDIEQYLLIEGGGAGGFPSVKIYRFPRNNSDFGQMNIQTIIDLDVDRIKSQYNFQSLEIENEKSLTNISFSYLTNIIIFQKKDKQILCKDWIGERENNFLLVSVCATEKQWDELDEVYENIIFSFN